MESPVATLSTRPWTPPDTRPESRSRYACLSDPFRSGLDARPSPSSNDGLSATSVECDVATKSPESLPGSVSRHPLSVPSTPTKPPGLRSALNAYGAPQYPYTPDSSRILCRDAELPSSPMPWIDDDDYCDSDDAMSPMQTALSSCIAHIKNLIQAQQPDEEQTEYIISQFEALARYLTAPKAQLEITDDQLFVRRAHEPDTADAHRVYEDGEMEWTKMPAVLDSNYVVHVGQYIEGVQKHVEDLKMRLDESKTLNSIQLDVIDNLRWQMKSVRSGLQTVLSIHPDEGTTFPPQHPSLNNNMDHGEDEGEDEGEDWFEDEDEKEPFGHDSWETIASLPHPQCPSFPPVLDPSFNTIIHKQPRSNFWSAFAKALDDFGSLFMED